MTGYESQWFTAAIAAGGLGLHGLKGFILPARRGRRKPPARRSRKARRR